MEINNIDATIIVNPKNLFYFTGCRFYFQSLALSAGTAAALIILRRDEAEYIVFMDDVERVDKESHVKNIRCYNQAGTLEQIISKTIFKNSLNRRIGVEGNFITMEILEKIRSGEHDKIKKFRDVSVLIADLRSIKDSHEIEKMNDAAKLGDLGLEAAAKNISTDKTEIEVAAFCEYIMRQKGAEGFSFGTIVASGENSANPNWVTSKDKIRRGYPIIVDLGPICESYCSDITRTFAYHHISKDQKRIFDEVLDLQEVALDKARPGVLEYEIDDAVIEAAKRKKLDRYLFHCSHGIGLDPVERPDILKRGSNPIKEGMVISIEVGLYIPKLGGVRAEDIIQVEKDRINFLSKYPRDKYILKS